ncbi:unnamed protein product [Meloidogyne enterolobii]|uniref:Uncharacterized protein n=1 Tax=Meloidogyne enterolobii TaxID=390850 RepID=A0ACB0YIV2_MELEN
MDVEIQLIHSTQIGSLLNPNLFFPLPFFRNVSLPPSPPNFKYFTKSSKNQTNKTTPIRILQLSDIHFDPAYLEGSEADCEEPVCCIKMPKKGESVKKKAGYWGTAAKCDIPLRTVENLLEHINRTHKLDFVLLSGDYLHHRDWGNSLFYHLNLFNFVFK